jgi:ParB family chromosome partitioning protein
MENVLRLDLHLLIPRFAPLRLRDPERLACLTRSMRQHGQLMPVVVVPEPLDPPRWVVIDGYRRLEALREIGEDLVWVDVWERPVDEALLLCLARGPERGWEAIEEAALLQELSSRYSLRELAQRIGRDVSWVSRRLSLFKALPEELLEAVRTGKLSVWAATRILAPLARANSAHARTLLGELEKTPLSARASSNGCLRSISAPPRPGASAWWPTPACLSMPWTAGSRLPRISVWPKAQKGLGAKTWW